VKKWKKTVRKLVSPFDGSGGGQSVGVIDPSTLTGVKSRGSSNLGSGRGRRSGVPFQPKDEAPPGNIIERLERASR